MKINSRNLARGLLLSVATAALGATAFAATDGAVGFNSTGTIDISLTVNDEVRISNLVDINLGVFAGADAVGSSSACVYRNGTGFYQISATGDGAGGAFTLTDGTGTVAYAIDFDDGNGAAAMSTGVTVTGLNGADSASSTCATTGNNATITATVLAVDAATLPAGSYAGTLTLVVAPE